MNEASGPQLLLCWFAHANAGAVGAALGGIARIRRIVHALLSVRAGNAGNAAARLLRMIVHADAGTIGVALSGIALIRRVVYALFAFRAGNAGNAAARLLRIIAHANAGAVGSSLGRIARIRRIVLAVLALRAGNVGNAAAHFLRIIFAVSRAFLGRIVFAFLDHWLGFGGSDLHGFAHLARLYRIDVHGLHFAVGVPCGVNGDHVQRLGALDHHEAFKKGKIDAHAIDWAEIARNVE